MSSFDRTIILARDDRCKAVARPAAPLPMTKTSVEKRRVKKSLASYGSKPSLGSIYGTRLAEYRSLGASLIVGE